MPVRSQDQSQLGMAESVDPIHIEDMTITRMCYTDGNDFSTIEDYEREEAEHDEQTKRTMGEKKVVSYGLYVVQGTISPSLAIRTGFSEDDLNKLFEALLQMYEFDNSASKQGMRAASPLIIFKHIGTIRKIRSRMRKRHCSVACRHINCITCFG